MWCMFCAQTSSFPVTHTYIKALNYSKWLWLEIAAITCATKKKLIWHYNLKSETKRCKIPSEKLRATWNTVQYFATEAIFQSDWDRWQLWAIFFIFMISSKVNRRTIIALCWSFSHHFAVSPIPIFVSLRIFRNIVFAKICYPISHAK